MCTGRDIHISCVVKKILMCNPLANRAPTDWLAEKDKCYVEHMILVNKSPYFAQVKFVVIPVEE